MLLTANSGAGKSWALRRLLEQTHGKIQQLVIDPEGEFYTLRERFDYVLAGRGGDCPAEPRSAALLARRLLELGESAILDLYELAPRDRVRFVRAFLEALINAPRALWHQVLVVIDEAHAFAPEKGHGEAESSEAVARLMAQGRKRGFAGVLATQRLSKLAKDVAAEANNVLIGRAALDVDLKRAAEALGLSKGDWHQIRSLPAGDFFAFGPALSETVKRVTIGPVQTAHPKAGARAAPPAPPREKVRAILAQLADLPKEAEVEARSAAELREKLRLVERELAVAKRAAPASAAPPAGEALARARAAGEEAGARAGRTALSKVVASAEAGRGRAARALDQGMAEVKRSSEALLQHMQRAADALRESIVVETEGVDVGAERLTARVPKNWNAAEARLAQVRKLDRMLDSEHVSVAGVDGPMQRILDAIAWLEALGVDGPYQRAPIAFLARYKVGSGGFNNPLGRLRSAGLVEYPSSGTIALTEAGRAAARAPQEQLTVDELHERVRAVVDTPMWRCLEPLLRAYPDSMSRDDLAAAAQYEVGSGGFNNPLGRLRSLEIIDYPSPGRVVALPVLFLDT
ncbi:MAG: hypothetical protein A3E78_11730 [Alphaproteobacteria bacterium RIFCSPHIGHO2_12_FULL_63_12]|nr:MAG: hypothetical protein A3E78_11730 [Alphaproteobacteria bacterium RIFCSPHIGHO2_12_FULL_63_12]